jgi:hypothetical protein
MEELAMVGIKDLVDSGLQEVPSIYVRPLHERPLLPWYDDLPARVVQIPVFDLSRLLSTTSAAAVDDDGGDVDPTMARSLVLQQIADACREWGFFQVFRTCLPPTFNLDNLPCL